jgi:hypothetical protein
MNNIKHLTPAELLLARILRPQFARAINKELNRRTIRKPQNPQIRKAA